MGVLTVPSMPPELRRKLRRAYPVFGAADLAVRWVAPAGVVFAVVARSWTVGGLAIVLFLVAWFVRIRQFPNIIRGEAGEDLPPSAVTLRRSARAWPQIEPRTGLPAVIEQVTVWCAHHGRWEEGKAEALLSPSPYQDRVDLVVELRYGGHAWKLWDLIASKTVGESQFPEALGRLVELRGRDVLDLSADGLNEADRAFAVVFREGNSWDLVETHIHENADLGSVEALERETNVPMPK